MSTLLELKSSVIRKVQRSQSLRVRREPTAQPNSPLVYSPDTAARRTPEGNGEFFERMKNILHKQEDMHCAVDAEAGDVCTVAPPPESLEQVCVPERMSRSELDLLYEEVVYTLVNRAGMPSPDHVTNEAELFSYIQRVFDIGVEEKDIIQQKVKESKRACFSLRVSVMKGRNLLAKDANGYSDPYCMLGILLGQSPRDIEERKERKFSFRKKKDKLEKRPSVREVLAAKCIQVTEVKPQTLNPVWNEHFIFEIDDVYSDLLHLDIWDHDDDVSVAEACRKLNEISGFKGMGRYFKQIAKSVRANGAAASATEENTDDFLGCLNIPINDIPVNGSDKWFKLEPRSRASKVQGECHLILRLFTTQRDTTLSKKELCTAIHEKILRQILEYEHTEIQAANYNWDGQVSLPAWTVLSHHVMQLDLTPLQQAIIRWKCYSRHHRLQRISYAVLLGLLKAIETKWDSSAVEGNEERSLADSFQLHIDYCLSLLKRLRKVFSCSNSTAITRCELLLRGLDYLRGMQAFKTVCPSRNELPLEIATVIKKSTVEWYEGIISNSELDEGMLEQQLRQLVLIVDAVCTDVRKGKNIYNKIFLSSVRVDFFSASYCQLEKLVANDVRVTMEKVSWTLEQEGFRLTQTMGETLIELYISLKTLRLYSEFLPLRDTKTLALTEFHEWFKTSIHKWLQIVHEKSCDRISRAVEMDHLLPVHSQVKHSTSAIDITACFNQIREYWTQLAWPDSAETFTFVTHLTDDFCRAAVWYCGLIKRKIERNQPGQEHKNLILQLCIALNNIEHVRVFLGNLPQDWDSRGLQLAMEDSCGAEGKEQINKALSVQLYNIDLDLQREAKRIITSLTDKMLSDLKRYIQHISLSPDSIQNDEAVAPLMKYLNDNLIILSGSLVKGNLSRVLQDLWTLLLRMIFDTIVENRGVQVEFYGRFQYTVEALLQFFHAEGEWMTLEDLCNSDFKALEEELRLNKCSSTDLIEQYFLEKISQQKTLKHSRFGRISVKFYYEPTDQRLTVEILHAADIIALDANGLSDPFVIVELCPLHLFPNAKSQRTQVKTKTLHPVFDEVFYFHVSPEQYRHRCACVSFTVMDYDWLSTNDFAGDAIVPLSDFCWPGRPSTSSAAKNLPPVILHLTRSKPSEKLIVKILEARTGDNGAQEFSRRVKEIEKSMEEE
ncbi:BAI1-associated protein 3-like [Scleropages formosus]|uniref:BAI1-associated protein 3-like n=1 Tax=Scleropages formosus TaxID=113540 RepID=UPI0010FAC1B4|nr:BAI1-associated protein 3-like [Scleropages formosus]